jgi:glycosyltransferase involved in cell wall biosynthesis
MAARAPALHLALYTDAPIYGGAEVSLGNLLAELPEDYTVTVMGTQESVVRAVAARRPGTDVALVPHLRSKLHIPAILRHVRVLRRLRPQVLHANLWTPWTCRAGIFAGLVTPGVKVLAVEQLVLPSSSVAQRLLKRVMSRRLAAHVAVGERTARALEEMVGLRHGSVRTIYNGVPEVPLDPLPRADNGLVIGSVGRLDVQKGFDVLIRALAQLPEARLVLIGDGPQRNELAALAAELAVADRVEMIGWRDDARRRLGSFDIFALPSRFEGFPLSIIEAMLAGTAVVATDIASIPEAVVHGQTGLLVRPEDPDQLAAALSELLYDGERRRTLADAARECAREHFTSAVMARRFIDLYAEVLTGRPPRGAGQAPRA